MSTNIKAGKRPKAAGPRVITFSVAVRLFKLSALYSKKNVGGRLAKCINAAFLICTLKCIFGRHFVQTWKLT